MSHPSINAAAEFAAENRITFLAYDDSADPEAAWLRHMDRQFDSERWVEYQPSNQPHGERQRRTLASFTEAEKAEAIKLGIEWSNASLAHVAG